MMGMMVRRLILKEWDKAKITDAEIQSKQIPTPGVEVEIGLSYLDDGNKMHLMNLYYPKGTTGTLPTILNIHGGGWMYGEKDLNKFSCMFLASLGFTVIGISYRLLPETNLQGQVQDIFASLHWLEKHGEKHHCDPNCLFITGDSAGGHLAGLTVCTQMDSELQKIYDVTPVGINIKAIAISHGALNATYDGVAEGILGKLVNKEVSRMMYGKKPKYAAWYGKASFAETVNGLALPPIMFVSSEIDTLYPQTQIAEQYLRSRNIPYTIKLWKKEQGSQLGHVFHVTHPEWPESKETNTAIAEFFKQTAGLSLKVT